MTDRYITVGELTVNDIGKMISVGDAETGMVTGAFGYLDVETIYVEDKSIIDTKPTRTPARFIYGIGVGYWESTFIDANTPATVID